MNPFGLFVFHRMDSFVNRFASDSCIDQALLAWMQTNEYINPDRVPAYRLHYMVVDETNLDLSRPRFISLFLCLPEGKIRTLGGSQSSETTIHKNFLHLVIERNVSVITVIFYMPL